MKPWSTPLAGQLDELTIDSALLRDNPLGDPHQRPLWVYTPPGYHQLPDRRYPSIYLIQGLTGQVDMWRNRASFRPTVLELIDGMFVRGEAPPCLVVMVDCWTSLGGSQYRDSPGTGRYHSYLCDEVVPRIDADYRTLAAREHRGIAGKSSGGYGAMITPMLRPDLFGALASHCGDALFECCYQPEFREAARALRDEHGGSYARFWTDFRSRPALTRASDKVLLNTYCMAACYSAEPDGTVTLPFDLSTGALIDEVWARWLACDPVRMAAHHAPALRGLRAIYLDSGNRDEYYLDLGATAFRRALRDAGVADAVVRFDLYDAGHAMVEYRYPLGLAHLAHALGTGSGVATR